MTGWSFQATVAAFLLAAAVIAVFGTWLARVADRLADATGLGEAITGALILGASTSMPGISTSVTAAADGHAELAVSNALGGIAAQTVFLALADMAYRNINLEHAAASLANLTSGALLLTLLSVLVLAMSYPAVQIGSIHPATVALLAAYVFGLRLVSRARTAPMWRPRKTRETRVDEVPDVGSREENLSGLWIRFVLLAVVLAAAGTVVARTGIALSEVTGLSETAVGGVLTAIATSMPELVTSVAAVRQGALTLAVGGVIGGNAFDVLFVAFSDVAYGAGSIYAALGPEHLFIVSLTMVMTGVLLLGLLQREKHGIGNIGFESVLVLLIYVTSFGWLVLRS